MACPKAIAPLETINFSLLATKDATEVAELLKSSETHGFFYLDLQNDSDAAHQIIEDMQGVLHVMEKYFGQCEETKMKDYRPSQAHG